jgi:hypothetical protein
MTLHISPKLAWRFKPIMRWEGDVEDFVRSRARGYTLNAPCGDSLLGDVSFDIDPSKGDVVGSLEHLYPDFFGKNTFDTVISDPPWKVSYFHRFKWFFNCVEVCKVGGIVIYNAPWLPESKEVELREIYFRQSASFANVSLISVFEKVKDHH